MELRSTREMRRNEQLSKAMAKRADAPASSAKPQAQPVQQPPADKFTLSRQALGFLEEHNRKMWERDMERQQRRGDRLNNSISELEGAKSRLDSMEKRLKVINKCQKIAASIMKGNRVPPEDLEYLMNNDPEGYKLAMAMRRENPDPEDEKSVLDEEDRNGGAREAGGGEGPSAKSAGAPEGGGGPAQTPAAEAPSAGAPAAE